MKSHYRKVSFECGVDYCHLYQSEYPVSEVVQKTNRARILSLLNQKGIPLTLQGRTAPPEHAESGRIAFSWSDDTSVIAVLGNETNSPGFEDKYGLVRDAGCQYRL